MALVIKKKAAVEVTAPAVELSPIAALIEAYGDEAKKAEHLMAEIKVLQNKLQPLKDAQKMLEEGIAALDLPDDLDQKLVHMSPHYRCTIGSKGTSREVADISKAKEILGDELFMELAKLKIGDLDKYMTEPQRQECVTSTRTGNSYKVADRE